MRLFPQLLALSIAIAAAGPSRASEEAAKAAPNPTVLMSPVALPIVVDGRLVNYIFVTIRLGLSTTADPPKMRLKEPYFRDALVRLGHRTPFVRPDTYTALDEPKLKAALIREANAIAGPGSVLSVQILKAQPQHYDGLPKPKTGPRSG